MLIGLAAQAAETGHSHASPYAGRETRLIKSLSPEDIAELRRGGGWGLARAAELNGLPGPAHLLEMKDEIALDAAQLAAIIRIRNQMRAAAIAEGERLISLEQALETQFRDGTVTDDSLRAALDDIAGSRRNLRYIHLSAHLETPGILSPAQIRKYNELRGYTAADPCAAVPQGHDPAMWRKHDGCE
jgi:deoxycytidylate deaminase